MRDVDSGSLEPLVGIDDPPHQDQEHGTAPDEAGPVHAGRIEIRPRQTRQTQDRDHEGGEARRQHADRVRELAQVPGPAAEAGADEEGPDRDGDGEGDEGANGADAENGTDGRLTAEEEQRAQNPNAAVEPHGVHGRLGVRVDLLPPARAGEAAVAGVGKGDARRGDHAPLAHGEAADDGQGEHGHGCVFREDFDQERRPGLA